MSRKKQKIIFIVILFFGLAFSYCWFYFQNEKKFWVRFLNIGQGDSALINFGNGEQMLVDCGADRTVLFRLGAALPLWDRTIDYLVATHPDRDHYGGCTDVLKRYHVKHIILNGHAKEYDPLWREFAAAVAAEQASSTVINGFLRWEIGSSTLEFLSPDDSLGLALSDADSNNYSVVFKLFTPRGQTILFTGDMEEPLERVLIKKYLNLKSDILKVGHHGSNSSSGEEFLRMVQPGVAVISSGKNNKFGHPSPRVIKHLERVGAKILRTDQVGDIIIK